MDEDIKAYRLLIADVYELAGASRRTSEALAAGRGQTAARWHVMSAVSEEAQTVPAIARRLGLTRQGVQRVVNDLEDADLVTLGPNPAHARSPLVALTEQGREDLEALFRRSEASRRRLLDRAGVSVEDLAAARRVVGALAAAVEAEEGGRRRP